MLQPHAPPDSDTGRLKQLPGAISARHILTRSAFRLKVEFRLTRPNPIHEFFRYRHCGQTVLADKRPIVKFS